MSELEKRYRRLLLAYPRRYRRTRGLEMLTTLLDASGPGQRRPAWRDALNLVAGGLRCRLALPGGRWLAVAMTLAALSAAALGAAGGARLGWRSAPELPSVDQRSADAARLAPPRLAVDDRTVSLEMQPPYWHNSLWALPVEFLGGTPGGARTGLVGVTVAPAPDAALAETGGRLRAEGWHTDAVQATEGYLVLVSHRNGVALVVTAQALEVSHATMIYLGYQVDEPPPVLPLAVLGGILLGVPGWFAAAAVARRATSRTPRAQPPLLATTVTALGLLLPATLATWLLLVPPRLAGAPGTPPPNPWAAYAAPLGGWTTVAGGLGALILVLTVLVMPRARTYSPGRAP
jgi:hypothetical protein